MAVAAASAAGSSDQDLVKEAIKKAANCEAITEKEVDAFRSYLDTNGGNAQSEEQARKALARFGKKIEENRASNGGNLSLFIGQGKYLIKSIMSYLRTIRNMSYMSKLSETLIQSCSCQ